MTSEELRLLELRLASVSQGRWTLQYLEPQGTGESVMVSVEVDSRLSSKEIDAIRADLRAVLRAHVPEQELDYAWTAVIKQQGVVVDSLMGGSRGGLPEI